MAFISGAKEAHAPIAKRWQQSCERAEWKFLTSTHDGGHHFQADWDEQRKRIAEFLTTKPMEQPVNGRTKN